MMRFLGRIPSSKSMLNRALVIQSYSPSLKIIGDSDCDDVQAMRVGLDQLLNGRDVECSEGGTVLRFLSLRASRIPGRHVLRGSRRLFARPLSELVKIMAQLSVTASLFEDHMIIESSGWRPQGDMLGVPSHRSSQFISAVLLNGWGLPFDLFVSPVGAGVSEGYWKMTQKMSEGLGMKIEKWDQEFRIPAQQKVAKEFLVVEPDMSSAFAVAAAAAVNGSAVITDFPAQSLQPDFAFVGILKEMNVPIRIENESLRVEKSPGLRGVHVRMGTMPDLFPVLATLAALAEGESELSGAPQLVFKESNRIKKVIELLQVTGKKLTELPDGLKISGALEPPGREFVFDPDQDHRLAMAASILRLAGYPLRILNAHVVNKSYPGYWHAIGWSP